MKLLGLLLIIASFMLKAEAQSLQLPYYTGFDSTSQQAGWQEFRLGVLSSFNWVYSAGLYSSSPKSLFHDYNVGGSPTDSIDDWFVSPPLNFNTSAQLNLKIFVATAAGTSPSDYFGIWFSSGTSNPASGNFYELADLTDMQPQFQWLDTSITITTVTDSGYIAFRYKSTDNWFQIWIDDVNIVPDSGKGTIDSLKILPQNPDSSDIVKVVCYTTFPSTDCNLDSSSIVFESFKVTINAYYIMGIAPAVCNSTDTIIIGNLNDGNYKLIYNVNTNYDSTVVSDSLNFMVFTLTDIGEQKKTEPSIRIYPNPAKENIRIEIATPGLTVKNIKLYEMDGKLIKTFSPTHTLLNVADIAKGHYLLLIDTDNETYSEKIILK